MKILLCNEAYIGDLILSTSLLPVLKKIYPDCQIGFLTGSWSKSVVMDHLFVDWVHTVDQVWLNRANIAKKLKKDHEVQTRNIALKEINHIKYDVAIDLHSYYKNNSSYLIYKAKIPERIGYWNCPQSFFYTKTLHWDCSQLHTLENHRMMLLHLDVDKKYLEHFNPCLHYHIETSKNSFIEKMPTNYFVIHPGSGTPYRDWEIAPWKIVASKLEAYGIPLVFIGKGKKEQDRIACITSSLKNFINLCDKLHFRDLLQLMRNAKFFMGMDSMGGHLAAYFGIPGLSVCTGEPFVADWRPYHPYCHVIKPDPKYWYAWRELYPKKPIDMLGPDAVFEKAEKILKAHLFRKCDSFPSKRL